MPFLDAIRKAPTSKNFTVATAIMRNEQTTHLYFSSVVSTGNEQDGNAHTPCVIITDKKITFWKKLEIGGDHPCFQEKDMDSKMRDLASLLDQISTRPISKVREMCCLAKEILSLVLPEDLDMTLTFAPESSDSGLGSESGFSSGSGSSSRGRVRPPRAPRGRGRGRRSGRSSLSSLGSVIDPSTGSTFPLIEVFPSFMYPFIENWKNMVGDSNYGYRIVADFVFADEHQWPEVRRRTCFKLELTNIYILLFGSLDTPNSLYVIANAFNLCVVLITDWVYDYISFVLMYAYCTLYACNDNIIVMIESAVGQSLIPTGLQIGTRDMLEHIYQEIPFMLTCSCFCN
ncbi:hypothetical protein M9H77_06376 [Catharanthus roseus]|uniref:Uncharacterized protein n=1 Tax=Catharanthus roseus TaxID=4058 RepID=A0ACC0BRZ4_CATRO|nr:hypothetical protein M9H77_06376 [Catharanthus roseus]